jgi:hypothetical protein
VLANRPLGLMPICACCQSKRCGILRHAKQFLLQSKSALACGLAPQAIIAGLSRLSLNIQSLNTACGQPFFPPHDLKPEVSKNGGRDEVLSWVGYETSRPCPVSIAPHGRAAHVPTHVFQPLLPRARQEESKSKF